MVAAGVTSWLSVLVQVSRRAAQQDALRRTQRPMNEIDAHGTADAALKRAKEVAEAANVAKSRYGVGLSHELRDTIMGDAQRLERDGDLAGKARGQVAVMRRGANHLSGLIDALLDSAKSEAGKLDLSRDEVSTASFLDEIVGMFAVEASTKGNARSAFDATDHHLAAVDEAGEIPWFTPRAYRLLDQDFGGGPSPRPPQPVLA